MKFRVLGPMVAEDPRGKPIDLKGLRQRAVLAVLLMENGRMVSTDRLADLVWDGEPPMQAAGTLQAYVSRLRRMLEPDRDGRGRPWEMLRTVGTGYQLDVPSGALDSARFEALCSEARECTSLEGLALLDEALGLWRGDPYSEFRYFNFARAEAHRLEERRWWAVERRAEILLELGRHPEVVADLAGVLPSAPYRERMRGQLMLALYRSGRQADALACYQEGRRVLVEDLGIDPGPELQELERAIITQDPSLALSVDRPATVPASPPEAEVPAPEAGAQPEGRPAMFGRSAELDEARSFLESVRAGRGGLLVVRGEAGIGKTRLAEEISRMATGEGVTVQWGRCPEMEGAPPFWPWMQILRQLFDAAELPDVLQVTSAPGRFSDPTGFHVYEAVRSLLQRAADLRPTVLILEDLHWADNASLRLLRFLFGSGSGALPFGVIATTRPEHASPALADIEADSARSDSIHVLNLQRLDRSAAEQLVAALTGEAVPARTLDRLLERSGGNPFFIAELVRLGAAGASGVPSGVKQVIHQRVGRLRPATKEMLTVAACCAGAFDLPMLSSVLSRDETELLDDVDEALATRLVKEVSQGGGGFEFTHPLVRDAIAAGVSTARRGHLHLRLATFLLGRAGDRPDDETVAAVSHHFSEAVVVGARDDAVKWSIEAARRDLNRGSAEDARERVLRTLDLARSAPPDVSSVVDLLILLGRTDRALGIDTGWTSIYEAMDLAKSVGDARRVVDASQVMTGDAWSFMLTFGRTESRLVAHLAWAMDQLETCDPARWVTAASAMATETVFSGKPGEAALLAGEALSRARQIGEPEGLLTALHARWVATWGPDSLAERAELVGEMEKTLAGTELDRSRTLLMRWATALEEVDPSGTELVIHEAEELIAKKPDASLSALLAWRRSLRAILDGRFDEAEKMIGSVYADAARFHPQEAFDAYSGQTALLYYLSGRFGELVSVLEQAIADQPHLLPAFGPPLGLALVEAGRPEDALRTLEQLGVSRLEQAPQAMVRSGTTSTLAVCCYRLGEPELAAAALRLLGDDHESPAVIDQVGVFYNGARAAHRGRLLTVMGRFDEGIAALERGLAVDQRAEARAFVLRDRIDLADALLRRDADGDRKRAESVLRESEADASELGLTGEIQRRLSGR